MNRMNAEEKKGATIGAVALVGLLLISLMSSLEIGATSLTGAVAGNSYVYKMCLSKYGKDIYGEWMWDEIKDCRENILEMEKGREAKSPRLYRSSDRSEYQNEE